MAPSNIARHIQELGLCEGKCTDEICIDDRFSSSHTGDIARTGTVFVMCKAVFFAINV